jgi:hypothetical protein
VPVREKSYMFGDNQSVVTNSSIPHSSLHKRHNALSYHRVREMIAAKILGYYLIDGKHNPADIVNKHWGYQHIWHLLKALLFYSGNTLDLVQESEIIKSPHLNQTSHKNCNNVSQKHPITNLRIAT